MFFDMEKKDLGFITQPKTKNAKTGEFETGFLINLVCSSGLGSSSMLERAGRIITDGFIVVVDCVSGVCSQTEVILRQAVLGRIKPVLFINLLDVSICELHEEEEVLYQTCQKIVEKVNVIIGTHSEDDGPMGVVRVDVNNGSVGFGSGLQGWAFSLKQFAEMYASKFGVPVDQMMKKLWGENFYNPKTKEWQKEKSEENKRSFCWFVLHPIYNVFDAIMNFRKEETEKLLSKMTTAQGKLLKEVLTADDLRLEGESLMECVMRNMLPADEALFQMITIHLPSPVTAQKYRAELLYEGPNDDLSDLAKLGIRNCDPKAPLVMYVSRMVPTTDSEHYYAFGRVFSGKLATGMKARIMGVDTGEPIQVLTSTFVKQPLFKFMRFLIEPGKLSL